MPTHDIPIQHETMSHYHIHQLPVQSGAALYTQLQPSSQILHGQNIFDILYPIIAK